LYVPRHWRVKDNFEHIMFIKMIFYDRFLKSQEEAEMSEINMVIFLKKVVNNDGI